MGRDVAGLRIDKKPNLKLNGHLNPAVHVAPKAVETIESNPENHSVKDGIPDDSYAPEEKIIASETQNSSDQKLHSPVKPASESAVNGTEKKETLCADHIDSVETHDSGAKCSPMSNDQYSPGTTKISQPNSPSMSGKQLHNKKSFDEEDNWSLASSTATSRTFKTRVTVPVAPKFSVVDRLERRKEFYSKLEEKHKALEKEKLECEARIKEEEQAAIKQLRRNMMYKANPVPSFYREGPPPKAELKKLPVTRAKSPNLTRRKSCGDAMKSSPDDKPLSERRATHHSGGIYREVKNSPHTPKSAPKSNDRTPVRKSSGSNKAKGRPQPLKETPENPRVKEHVSADITVES